MYPICRFFVHIMGDMYPKMRKWVHRKMAFGEAHFTALVVRAVRRARAVYRWIHKPADVQRGEIFPVRTL